MNWGSLASNWKEWKLVFASVLLGWMNGMAMWSAFFKTAKHLTSSNRTSQRRALTTLEVVEGGCRRWLFQVIVVFGQKAGGVAMISSKQQQQQPKWKSYTMPDSISFQKHFLWLWLFFIWPFSLLGEKKESRPMNNFLDGLEAENVPVWKELRGNIFSHLEHARSLFVLGCHFSMPFIESQIPVLLRGGYAPNAMHWQRLRDSNSGRQCTPRWLVAGALEIMLVNALKASLVVAGLDLLQGMRVKRPSRMDPLPSKFCTTYRKRWDWTPILLLGRWWNIILISNQE